MEPRGFDVTGRLHLLIRIRSGDIRIRTTEPGSATMHVTGGRKDGDVVIDHETTPSGTRLQVTERKDVGGWILGGRGLQIDVGVPPGTAAEIVTGSGDLVAETALGELTFQTGSGDARIGAVDGSVRLTSASGDVRVGAIEGDVSLATASGDAQIGSIGGTLSGRSASGDIEIGDLSGGGEAMSASGDITIGGTSADLTLRSVSGDIEIGVPPGKRVWLDLSSTSGETVSDLEPGADGDEGPEGGAFEISATTVSGDIRIRRAHTRDEASA